MKELLSAKEVTATIDQLIEQINLKHPSSDYIIVGIQQGGVTVADEMVARLANKVQYGQLDITFYRDDIRNEILTPDRMNIPFGIEEKIVVLVDDVLFTGRTIKAALDVLLDYGRPAKVELCVLIDRKEHRQFPIQADYVGKEIATKKEEKVKLVKEGKTASVVLLP
jgi:pyrimidine operon attenuation protein/uracil phosphoribosyltransferase